MWKKGGEKAEMEGGREGFWGVGGEGRGCGGGVCFQKRKMVGEWL